MSCCLATTNSFYSDFHHVSWIGGCAALQPVKRRNESCVLCVPTNFIHIQRFEVEFNFYRGKFLSTIRGNMIGKQNEYKC